MKKSISYSPLVFFPSEFDGFVWYEDLEFEERNQPCLGFLCQPVHEFSSSFYVLDCCYSYQGASQALHIFLIQSITNNRKKKELVSLFVLLVPLLVIYERILYKEANYFLRKRK